MDAHPLARLRLCLQHPGVRVTTLVVAAAVQAVRLGRKRPGVGVHELRLPSRVLLAERHVVHVVHHDHLLPRPHHQHELRLHRLVGILWVKLGLHGHLQRVVIPVAHTPLAQRPPQHPALHRAQGWGRGVHGHVQLQLPRGAPLHAVLGRQAVAHRAHGCRVGAEVGGGQRHQLLRLQRLGARGHARQQLHVANLDGAGRAACCHSREHQLVLGCFHRLFHRELLGLTVVGEVHL
mmetsp:Transcript_13044/g.31925  ORF Transcript_13044/g.31925 Transcript_13044/m.31925 type:complete len:235 (-) Transcript_13044:702-1406(-)